MDESSLYCQTRGLISPRILENFIGSTIAPSGTVSGRLSQGAEHGLDISSLAEGAPIKAKKANPTQSTNDTRNVCDAVSHRVDWCGFGLAVLLSA